MLQKVQPWQALRISVIGPFRVESDTGVDVTPRSSKAAGIIAMLALTPDFKRPRRWLETQLWSDRSAAQASGSLRQCLSELRRSLGDFDNVLQADRANVWLRKDLVQVDIRHDSETARASLNAGREFLEGLAPRDKAYLEWHRRERLCWLKKLSDDLDSYVPVIGDRVVTLTMHASMLDDQHAKRVAVACREMIKILLSVDVEVDFTH
ncbi:MAG: AfsR/SARP family transcriptional regulator [Paracoccaceae bacterium]